MISTYTVRIAILQCGSFFCEKTKKSVPDEIFSFMTLNRRIMNKALAGEVIDIL